MIEWMSLLSVALASVIAAVVVVGFYSVALRLLPERGTPAFAARRVGAIACFVICGLAIAYGIYLIIPAFHQA